MFHWHFQPKVPNFFHEFRSPEMEAGELLFPMRDRAAGEVKATDAVKCSQYQLYGKPLISLT